MNTINEQYESEDENYSANNIEYNYDTMCGHDINYHDSIIHKNMNASLKQLFGIKEEKNNEIDWNAPSKSGLENSEPIIPTYYVKSILKKNNILDIDYYSIIKDDIRNYRPLNKYQLEYVKNLNHKQKNELFDIYNNCIEILNEILKEEQHK
jgi:hypothetical protein